MYKQLIALAFVLSAIPSVAQFGKDTTVVYYNYNWEKIPAEKKELMAYYGISWPENGKYHKQDYFLRSRKMQMEGFYSDKDLNVRDGIFKWYDEKGRIVDSCFYVMGKQQGTELLWNEDGTLAEVRHWQNGIPVDTALGKRKDGSIAYLQVTDSAGNGFYEKSPG